MMCRNGRSWPLKRREPTDISVATPTPADPLFRWTINIMPSTLNEQSTGSPPSKPGIDGQSVNRTFGPALLDPNLEIPDGVIGPDGQVPPKRFAVYRNNVVVSLMEALGQAYPSIKSILGEEDFRKVARLYVASHPPKSPMMQMFGQEFADFLARFEPLSKSAFFVDLAKLERLWLEAHHAADDPILDPQALGSIAPENLTGITFTSHPAATLLGSSYPIVDLFHRRHDSTADIDLSLPQIALITRPQTEVRLAQITPAQHRYFRGLSAGETLGTALEAAGAVDPGFDPAATIGLMLESGFCSALKAAKATL